MTDKEIRNIIEKRRKDWRCGSSVEAKYKAEECDDILELMDEQEEPVSSIDFEKELYKAFGQVKDFTLGMRIAKWFYDMGKNSQEPVSEDLEEACEQLAENARKHKAETLSPFFSQTDYKQGVIDGAKWQKEQMMKDAVERKVKVDAGGYPYIDCDGIELYDYENDKPLAKKGQKAKVIIILED